MLLVPEGNKKEVVTAILLAHPNPIWPCYIILSHCYMMQCAWAEQKHDATCMHMEMTDL